MQNVSSQLKVNFFLVCSSPFYMSAVRNSIKSIRIHLWWVLNANHRSIPISTHRETVQTVELLCFTNVSANPQTIEMLIYNSHNNVRRGDATSGRNQIQMQNMNISTPVTVDAQLKCQQALDKRSNEEQKQRYYENSCSTLLQYIDK